MERSSRALVERFYYDVWDRHDRTAAREILHAEFRFRASLGPERVGADGFIEYLDAIHQALGGYTSVIDDLVDTGTRAAVRLRFSGTHRDTFFGVPATGRHIVWAGAAFFTTDGRQITDVWVLGDIDAVKQQLGADANAQFRL